VPSDPLAKRSLLFNQLDLQLLRDSEPITSLFTIDDVVVAVSKGHEDEYGFLIGCHITQACWFYDRQLRRLAKFEERKK